MSKDETMKRYRMEEKYWKREIEAKCYDCGWLGWTDEIYITLTDIDEDNIQKDHHCPKCNSKNLGIKPQ